MKEDMFAGGRTSLAIAPIVGGLSKALNTVRSGATETQNYYGRVGFKYNTTFKEKHFRDLYKVTIKCMGFKTHTETLLSEGRADLDIEASKFVYVMELKVVNENDPQKIEERLLEAKAQIKDLKYDKRLDKWLNGREVVGLACVIVNQNKDEKHDTPFREVVKLEEVG